MVTMGMELSQRSDGHPLDAFAPAAERRMIMKIRITIMTENNKHLDEKYSKELIEQKAKDGWDFALKALALSSENNETASVESCELVER